MFEGWTHAVAYVGDEGAIWVRAMHAESSEQAADYAMRWQHQSRQQVAVWTLGPCELFDVAPAARKADAKSAEAVEATRETEG